jgi:dihydroceramidase
MTGAGAYFYLVWGIWLRHCLKEDQDDYALSWPSIFSLPDIVRAKKSNGHANGRTNGTAKKTI